MMRWPRRADLLGPRNVIPMATPEVVIGAALRVREKPAGRFRHSAFDVSLDAGGGLHVAKAVTPKGDDRPLALPREQQVVLEMSKRLLDDDEVGLGRQPGQAPQRHSTAGDRDRAHRHALYEWQLARGIDLRRERRLR